MSEELAELNRRAGEARNERAAIEIRQAEAVTRAEEHRRELPAGTERLARRAGR